MEGELAILEAAWKNADEIAGIADILLVPAEVDEFITSEKKRAPSGPKIIVAGRRRRLSARRGSVPPLNEPRNRLSQETRSSERGHDPQDSSRRRPDRATGPDARCWGSSVRRELVSQTRTPEITAMSTAYEGPHAAYFVAELAERIVGGAGIGPLPRAEPHVCELRKMYLLSSARGHGIGRRLLETCLEEARSWTTGSATSRHWRRWIGRETFTSDSASSPWRHPWATPDISAATGGTR